CSLCRRRDRLRCWIEAAGALARVRQPMKELRMLRLFLAAGLTMAAAALPLESQQIIVNKDNRTIAVTTSADASAPADTVSVQIGFIAYAADQTTAYANGSKISNAIAAALKQAGVPADAIESQSQNISPVQQYNSQNWTPAEKANRQFQVQ